MRELFPDCRFPMATLTIQIGNYDSILGKSLYHGQSAELEEARKLVERSLKKIGGYVNTTADGDGSILKQVASRFQNPASG